MFCTFAVGQTDALPEVLSLKLYNIHTQEKGTFVFKRNGVYDRAGLTALNNFLRDWRKERPTNMDPRLFDLIWQVYRNSGSRDYVHVVCGFRSPETNGMLRRRSKGVAENSLHMQGKAMDFFIPDVPLSKLREVGMRLQIGGVGFYPTSGSPFVHMDVGNVRHWPRMTRQQLVKVFPNGRTLYIPTDGKPLPGYNEALAEYKARKAGGGAVATFAVASNDDLPSIAKPAKTRTAVGEPLRIAAVDTTDEEDDAIAAEETLPAAKAVAVASIDTDSIPLPHLAPRQTMPVVIAAAAPSVAPASAPQPLAKAQLGAVVLAALEPRNTTIKADFNFGSMQDWSAPAVPSALAAAMAERNQLRRGTSLPIAPTAVVATIDVSRPLRAEAITTAVLRSSNNDASGPVPQVMAYAEPEPMPAVRPRIASITGGMPLPSLRPRNDATTTIAKIHTVTPRPVMEAPELTMTTLDTQGLRLWMAPQSTRQKAYALLTMPDFAQMPELMDKPSVTFSAGFGQTAYSDLRTDRFSGALVQQPRVIDLSARLIASAR